MVANPWKYLIGSSILSAGLLLKAGAPAGAIALGLVLVTGVMWFRQRSTPRLRR